MYEKQEKELSNNPPSSNPNPNQEFEGYQGIKCTKTDILSAANAMNSLDEKFGSGVQIMNGLRSNIKWGCAPEHIKIPATDNINAEKDNPVFSRNLTSLLSPATIASLSVKEVETVVAKAQTDLKKIITTWGQEAHNIQEFKECSKINDLEKELNVQIHKNASSHEIFRISNALKDAKAIEQVKRIDFDNTIQTLDALLGVVSGLAIIASTNKTAGKIINNGAALLKISKELGALAGWTTMASAVSPALAAVNIALAFGSLFSTLTQDEDNSAEILESLNELKIMLGVLRKEMHERFNTLEEKLEKIYLDITYRIRQISVQNEKTQLLIQQHILISQKSHSTTHQHLETVQKKIDELYSIAHSNEVDQALHAVTDPIRCSLNNIDIRPTPEQYADLLAKFQLNLEQSAFSAQLSGERNKCTHHETSHWSLQDKQPSEALFHINSLIGYCATKNLTFKNIPIQPHMLLWAYPSLAILRLIFLTNNSDTALIRHNEFNLLELIKTKAEEIKQFKLQVKNSELVTILIQDYKTALIKVADEMDQYLSQLNRDKNELLNQQLNLKLKTSWTEDANLLSSQTITIRTDYSNWFYCWTVTHYGGIEAGTRCVTQPKANYIAARTHNLNSLKKAQPLSPINQNGIQLENQQQNVLNIKVSSSSTLRTCIIPELQDDPILSLVGENQITINLSGLLDLPNLCHQAEYLDLGELVYRYGVDTAKEKMFITAYFKTPQSEYPVKSLELHFNIGPYERKEGILWGWLGNTHCTLTTAGPIRWLGSTGEAKHWFDDYGYVPVLAFTDAGPLNSLANPQTTNARPFVISSDPIYAINLQIINQKVQNKLKEILTHYETALKNHALAEGSKLNLTLTELEAAYQRLYAYTMISLPDDYANQIKELAFFYEKNIFCNKTTILNALLPENVRTNSSFLIPALLKSQAYNLNTLLENPLHQLLNNRQLETNDNLFDLIYSFIDETYAFYKDRVQETGTYKDIFTAHSETEKKYETVMTWLNILTSAISTEVTDQNVMEKILDNIQSQMTQHRMSIDFVPSPTSAFSQAKAITQFGMYSLPENFSLSDESPMKEQEQKKY